MSLDEDKQTVSKSKEYDENKISSNEINEVLEEEGGQHNKCPNGKSEELKDNIEKQCRKTVAKYKTNGSEEWKKRDYEHTAK